LTNTTNAVVNIWQRNLETAYTTYTLPASALVPGTNVLAVSVHNAINTTVSDVSFNLSLEGTPAAGNDTAAPSVPSDVAVTGTSMSSVSLSWGASTDDTIVAGYRIFRDGVEIDTTVTPGYTDSGLAAA